jgi:predicted nucleotidyltransferase
MDDYLAELFLRLKRDLGAKLLGVTLYGSHAAGAGDGISSDIDIIVVVREATSGAEREALARSLDHAALPVPGAGLELAVLTQATACDPRSPVRFDWALNTGRNRETEIQDSGIYDEIVLDLAQARAQGRSLYGPPPEDLFGTVPRAWLLQVLVHSLEWHLPVIGDPYHDPGGQNAVLNAGRALLFAETGSFGTKTQGGLRLTQDPAWQALAEGALALRSGRRTAPLERAAVARLLRHAIDMVAQAMTS